MKKVILLFLFCGVASLVLAQQDPLYSQYINNPMVINPAYAGLNDKLNASISYRNQWGGFDGSPTTVNVNSHISLVDNKLGAGVLLIQDNIGSIKNTELQAAFSYKLKLQDKTFSFGMQTGFINFRNNYSSLNLSDQADPAFVQNENITQPNLGVGVIVKAEKYFIGLSVPRLLNTNISNVSNSTQEFQLYDKHYYLFGSYVFYLNERLRLKPSVLLKGVKGSPLSTDLNFNINIDEKYAAGIFTRNLNAFGLLLQAKFLDKFRLGYTFEVPTSNSVGARFNTHELFFGIAMPVLNFHDRAISNF
ncbi:MAG: type IX secretion system membrane protein PorP/SprF [Bacteroidota bacterium]